MHNYLLRQTAADIALLLTYLVQQSLRTAILLNDWKKALVTPIAKKGEKSDPKNYWHSWFSYFCNLQNHIEHVIVSHIMKHLEFE